jgi:hypothetical protein
MDQLQLAGIRHHSYFILLTLLALAGLLAGCDVPPAAKVDCSLASFTPAATWNGVQDSALVGQMTLTNYTGQDCPLAGKYELSLLDENHQPMAVTALPDLQDFSGVIQPGQSFQLAIRWQNWCGQIPGGALTLQLKDSISSAVLIAALQDPNGQPLDDTPGCLDPDQPSLLLWGE